MRLHRLTLRHVRGVEEREVPVTDGGTTTGVTIVEGPNEAGKSTLGDALDALLTYKDSSRHADVRGLRTVGRDEPPEVEAELELGDHRLVYRKRFCRRPATELAVTGPRPETLTGDEAHARVEQLLAEHLDVGLWSALRMRQGEGIAQAGPGGTSGLATALAGHGAASAIGDRELAVLEQVRREYERYLTPRTGAPKPLLRDAEAEVTERTRRLADLDARREELQADVEHADRLDRELPQLRHQVEEAAARAKELEDLRAEVDALADRVRDRERAEEAAGTSVVHLRERRRHRVALVEELTDVEASASRLDDELAELDEARLAAGRRHEEARARLAEAQRDQREARALRARAQAVLDRLQDRAALDGLRDRAARATEARGRLREAEATLAAVGVDEDTLTGLREAQREATRAAAARDAASPQLTFTAARSVQVVTDDGAVDLAAGEQGTWRVHGERTLVIGDVGELRLRAGVGGEDAVADHDRAAARLAELLAEAGVADLDAAESALRSREEAQRTAEHARRELDLALAGSDPRELDDEIERLERRLAGARTDDGDEPPSDAPCDPAEARRRLDEAREAERAAEEALAAAEDLLEPARAELDAHRERQVECRTRAEEARRRATGLRTELEEARGRLGDDDLEAQLADAERQRQQALDDLRAARAELAEADPGAVTSRADNAAEVLEDARSRLQRAEQDQRDVRVRIAALGGDGLWEQREEAATALAHAEQRLAGLRRRATAARVLLETLERHRDAARDRYAAPLREQLRGYGRILHGPEFDVELDDDLRVARRHLDGIWLDVESLSIGAREQLALLGRLACATLLGDRGGLLLFDDALGNSDPERLEGVGAVLRLAGEHCQVLVLTCYPDRYRHVGGARRIRL